MSEPQTLRVLIISDTHGRKDRIEQVVRQIGRHDLMLHAGDHAEDVLDSYKKALTVCGNCDPDGICDTEQEFSLLGVRGLLVHGHLLNVKTSPLPLMYKAAERMAQLAVFGHTHTPTLVVEEGRVLLNPGSLSYPRGYTECTYATVDLTRTANEVQAVFAFHTLGGVQIPAFDLTHVFSVE
ncbi:MAG: YfcE family phosphodiesterase [Tumebacillaceae bacterium]